ncbi:hypothetical protein SAMN05421505_12045 [Sinosporangium album]|uniref:Uncharacterized protein n=1 Tax=Sinosporangium album TaxID=504805 RepID=A0A1G8EDB4_9ACTN|nr:hypothetical protein [Sinosporangium album]SDH67770.1 hypothetical protein SAMN05421505_12045 [Sinosporangium album]
MTPLDARRRRDLAAIALIALGATGLLIVAYQAHPLLGWAGVSALALVGGLLLGSGQ